MDFLKLLHMSWIIWSSVPQFDPSLQLVSDKTMSILTRDCDKMFFNCETNYRYVCHCDPLCTYYNDCCFGAPTNKLAGDQQSHYASISDCQGIEFSFGDHTSKDHITMISKCPTTWSNNSVKARCEINNNNNNNNNNNGSVLDFAPVSNANGDLTFKNRFCATCNGVLGLKMFDLEMQCQTQFIFEQRLPFTESIANAMSMGTCSYRYILDKVVQVRRCFNQTLTSLSHQELTINITACHHSNLGPLVIFTTDKQYLVRNRECAKHVIDIVNSSTVYCFRHSKTQSVYSYGGVIKLSKLHTTVLSRKATDCGEIEIYLSSKDGCQDLHCPSNFVPFFGECLNKSVITNDTNGVSFEFLFQANDTVTTDFYDDFRAVLNPVFKPVGGINLRFSMIIPKAFNGSISNNTKSCTLLRFIVVVKSTESFNTTSRAYTTTTVRQHLRGFSTTEMNVMFEYIENINESTCKIKTALDNSRHILSNFDTYQNQHVPCPAVLAHRYNGTSGTGSTNGSHVMRNLYRIPSTMTSINKDDIVKSGHEYYVCTRTYFATYVRASAGSSCYYAGFVTTMVTVFVAILQRF